MNRRDLFRGLLGAAVCAVARIFPTPTAQMVSSGGRMFIGGTREMAPNTFYDLFFDDEAGPKITNIDPFKRRFGVHYDTVYLDDIVSDGSVRDIRW